MRLITRQPLSPKTLKRLQTLQANVLRLTETGELACDAHWKRFKGPHRASVKSTLERMAGDSCRCMYCSDSQGNEVEHFWPKSPYPGRMYDWQNLLLVCGPCNGHKSDQFPLDDGHPVLIDPAVDNPWDYLDFNPTLGTLTPRFDKRRRAPKLRGVETCKVLRLDREALERGNKNTWNHLRRIAEEAIDPRISVETAVRNLRDADTRGFLGWVLTGTGYNERPFPELRRRRREVWAALTS